MQQVLLKCRLSWESTGRPKEVATSYMASFDLHGSGRQCPESHPLLIRWLFVATMCSFANNSCTITGIAAATVAAVAACTCPHSSLCPAFQCATWCSRQHVLNAVLAALVDAGGLTPRASAGVVAAVPGAMGKALAEQVVEQTAGTVTQAASLGRHLAEMAEVLLMRAAALLDPQLAPAAAYMARKLPPGQNGKPYGVDALLGTLGEVQGGNRLRYRSMLLANSQQTFGVIEQLTAAAGQQAAAPARKQAAKLAQLAGGGAAEAEQLCQQLRGVWLGNDTAAMVSSHDQEQPAEGAAGFNGSSTSPGATRKGRLPPFFAALGDAGVLQLEEVLAAGDPAQWTAAVTPVTPANQQVAATAIFAACKAAGAVAQLPQLLEQVHGVLKQQPSTHSMGADTAARMDLPGLRTRCRQVAEWAVLLAPLLGQLLTAEQAAQLMEETTGLDSDSSGHPLLMPDDISRVLGLLGHVVAPGAPGCSYPGCCNLEGRSEAELAVQVCTRCRGARYCCREHQVAHWKAGHKVECQAAQAAVKQVLDVGGGGSDQV